MSNFQIHELTEKAINRNSNIIHDTLSGGSYETGKNLAGAVADLASANVAAPYNSATTYAIGQYCLYEGNIYRCIAITTGTFDATKWTQIVVTSEFRRVVELTTAQYEALSSAEQNNGTLYIITDGIPPSETVTGSDIIPFIDVSDSNKPKSTTAAAVAELGKPSVVTGTFTPSTNITVLRSSLYKIGDIKFLSVIFQVTGTATSLGTVSTGFGATYNIDFTAMSDANRYARFRIQSNSNSVDISTTPENNTYYAFTISYI